MKSKVRSLQFFEKKKKKQESNHRVETTRPSSARLAQVSTPRFSRLWKILSKEEEQDVRLDARIQTDYQSRWARRGRENRWTRKLCNAITVLLSSSLSISSDNAPQDLHEEEEEHGGEKTKGAESDDDDDQVDGEVRKTNGRGFRDEEREREKGSSWRRRDKETMHASSTLVYLIDHYDYSPKQTVNSPLQTPRYGCATGICISNAFWFRRPTLWAEHGMT